MEDACNKPDLQTNHPSEHVIPLRDPASQSKIESDQERLSMSTTSLHDPPPHTHIVVQAHVCEQCVPACPSFPAIAGINLQYESEFFRIKILLLIHFSKLFC